MLLYFPKYSVSVSSLKFQCGVCYTSVLVLATGVALTAAAVVVVCVSVLNSTNTYLALYVLVVGKSGHHALSYSNIYHLIVYL